MYYIIRQESSGRGLFSLLSSVVCHIDFAEKNSLIPIVDFENYRTVYNEAMPINGTMNAFEYYFLPLNDLPLADVYCSNNYTLSNNSFPDGYNFTIANDENLYGIFDRYFVLNNEVSKHVRCFLSSNFSRPTLGVHYRGNEQRTARGHWFPPSYSQMMYAIDKAMSEYKYEAIFVSSECMKLISYVEKRYPDLVFYNPNYYRSRINAYKIYPRPNHLYRLGLEVLTDMFSLSKCTSLISCSSNVPWFSRYINKGGYKSHLFINNGPNNFYYPINNFSWYIKSVLPSFLGGFRADDLTVQEVIG